MQWPVIFATLVLVMVTNLQVSVVDGVVGGGGGGGGGGGEFPGRGVTCDFETPCPWTWNRTSGGAKSRGFQIIKTENLNKSALAALGPVPLADADNNTKGSYLLLRTMAGDMEFQLKSTTFTGSINNCRLEAHLYMVNMTKGVVKLVAETESRTSWFIDDKHGNNESQWLRYSAKIGQILQDFWLLFEFLPPRSRDSLVAIDNLRLVGCFLEEKKTPESCTPQQYECMEEGVCIDRSAVCDIVRNCLHGDDEEQNCDELPDYSRCDFQEDWCGWTQPIHQTLSWTLHKGETPSPHTGPHFDNTYANETGYYALVNMASQQMGASAILESATFNPPPCYHNNISSKYYNSCEIRFFYHMFGPHAGSLSLSLVEVTPQEKRTVSLWWTYGNKGDNWWRKKVKIPVNVTHRYYIQFEARKGITARSDVALDDISFSPECFGIGVPSNESCDYCYDCLPFPDPVHPTFINKTMYVLGTCGVEGRFGPTQENCTQTYENTNTRVTVLENHPFAGIQDWVVPEDGFYTIIAKGASGSKGFNSKGETSRGAVARMIVELKKGQHIFALVGQEGGHIAKHGHVRESNSSKIEEVKTIKIVNGGGGGGGGTFVFLMNKDREPQPLLVAAGGGGLARNFDLPQETRRIYHGHGVNITRQAISGQAYGDQAAGAGGGWRDAGGDLREENGQSLLQGARGGHGCNFKKVDSNNYPGGFGGGGGGCLAGGGGGGWIGGNAWSSVSSSGEGGSSFLGPGIQGKVQEGVHTGPGTVLIIPAQPGCLCDYRCAALDENRHQIQCLCPINWYLADDNTSCILKPATTSWSHVIYLVVLIAIVVLLLIFISIVCFLLYNHYQRKRAAARRNLMLSGPDVQLNRLREASDSMMTEYNPNYEFGGGTYTIRDLKDIPREQLRLIRALGQGAFGEVYQGFFRHRPGDAVEMPVAVKTLPELSTNQAESDFLMEALIMSKFSHPNIVHFIGVCFDKHPRFIVLELLAGGDLKTFLRESRPKPERPSPLTMRDLLMCAIDVAKGCKYMEDNRFIHRDIAARNCLLTTKGPGRVVKIADFGMARDIYRADYYRKGGKAMLPIKWMPPEAFLDGIFTSKTDVWSFGVLLWEVMSLGYMPYTGCGNRDVMQLVTSGGRLEPPSNCPGPLYGIMMQCWHPNPDERPNFSTILERLGYCSQDPDVMNSALPVFVRPPSAERDATIMRPPASENSCLQVQRAADYLVPLHGPDVPSSPSSSSVDKLLGGTVDWETSFVLPESRSTQPLLQEEDPDNNKSNITTTHTIATTTSTAPTSTSSSTNVLITPLVLNSVSISSSDNNHPSSAATSFITTNAIVPSMSSSSTNPHASSNATSSSTHTENRLPPTQTNHLGSKRSNNSLKGSLSLDPAALGPRPPLAYANVSVTAQPASAPPDAAAMPMPPPPPAFAMVAAPPPPRHDSEISC